MRRWFMEEVQDREENLQAIEGKMEIFKLKASGYRVNKIPRVMSHQ